MQSYNNSFKVMTFNLCRDWLLNRGNRAWAMRKDVITRIIENVGADVVGVQEMLPFMKEYISNNIPDYTMHGIGRTKEGEHTDILLKSTRAEIVRHETFWLSKHPERQSRAYYAVFPRICTVGEVEIKRCGRKVRVFNAHFDHVCAPARVLAVRTILHKMHQLQKINPMPCILMGDFNALPGSREMRILTENLHDYPDIHLTNVNPQNHSTYHGFMGGKGKLCLDYIFVSDGLAVQDYMIERFNNKGVYPSDHYPLLAILKFTQNIK